MSAMLSPAGSLFIGKVIQRKGSDPATTSFDHTWILLGKATQVQCWDAIYFLRMCRSDRADGGFVLPLSLTERR